jgi:hypothetical protein
MKGYSNGSVVVGSSNSAEGGEAGQPHLDFLPLLSLRDILSLAHSDFVGREKGSKT